MQRFDRRFFFTQSFMIFQQNGNAMRHWRLLCALTLLLGACTPTPEGNVIGYLLAKRVGRFEAPPPAVRGSVEGVVLTNETPLAGATVVLAERNGRPHSAQTDAQGRYRIDDAPPGQYSLAAIAPHFAESRLQDKLGLPGLVTIQADRVTEAPPITLQRHTPTPLPEPLAAATQLTLTHTAVVTAAFPAGSQAQMQAFQFTYAGAIVPNLRLYLPTNRAIEPDWPLLMMVYPTAVDAWQSVSTAYAALGFAVVAVSPVADRALNIDAHAQDARIALALANKAISMNGCAIDRRWRWGAALAAPSSIAFCATRARMSPLG